MSDTTQSHGAALTLCWLPRVSEIFLIDAKLILSTPLPPPLANGLFLEGIVLISSWKV